MTETVEVSLISLCDERCFSTKFTLYDVTDEEMEFLELLHEESRKSASEFQQTILYYRSIEESSKKSAKSALEQITDFGLSKINAAFGGEK